MPHLRGIAQSATWCPNVASLAHVASGSQVASPNVTSKCGVTCRRSVREPGGVAGRGVKMWRHLLREPVGVAGLGVKTWRHLPTWRQGATWRQNVASLADVASGTQVASQDVASKCGVTCPRGVREPGGVAGHGVRMWRHLPTWQPGGVTGRGVKMWRHLPTWRQGARGRRRTWRQNVASLAYVASGSHVRSPGLCPALTRVASLGVAERGVKMWRHLPTWRQGATWRRRTWRQNVASGAVDLRGVTGRGVNTWRHEARPPGTCLQNVSSVVGRYVHPHRRPPCMYIHVYIYVYVCMYIYIYLSLSLCRPPLY